MLSQKQLKLRDNLLSPLKQKLFYLKSLPMAFITGLRFVRLDEEISVTEVPFRWRNKNPFKSMYFAVESMAAELSTAAPVFLALEGVDADIAFIITELKSEFIKKAQSRVSFTCVAYHEIFKAINGLNKAGDMVTVTAKTIGTDKNGDEVAVFYFTWSFKVRA